MHTVALLTKEEAFGIIPIALRLAYSIYTEDLNCAQVCHRVPSRWSVGGVLALAKRAPCHIILVYRGGLGEDYLELCIRVADREYAHIVDRFLWMRIDPNSRLPGSKKFRKILEREGLLDER